MAQKIAVEGVIAGLQPDQHVFLCVQSQAFGRLIYPQGKSVLAPQGNGQSRAFTAVAAIGMRHSW